MMPPPHSPSDSSTRSRCTTVYLGQRSALAQATADWLLQDYSDQLLDLSSTLVLVPTANSGRLLRAALVDAAATNGRGVLPPLVQTPEQFIQLVTSGHSGVPFISEIESMLLWSRTLLHCRAEDFSAIFPILENQTPQWALGVARRLVQVQTFLADGGMDIAAAARHPATQPEQRRWQQLEQLDLLYREQLQQLQKTDLPSIRLLASENPSLPAHIRRIVLAAVADPVPLAVRILEKLMPQLPVTVLLAADATDRQGFDTWGRPLPGYWTQRLNIAEWPQRFHLCANPNELADRATELTGPTPSSDVAMVVCDPDLLPSLERSFETIGRNTFDPAGTPAGRNHLSRLLQIFHQAQRERSIQSLAELLQHPLFAKYAASTLGISAPILRDVLDRFRQRHLCTTLDSALQVVQNIDSASDEKPPIIALLLHFALECLTSLRPGAEFASSLDQLLARIYRGYVFNSSKDKTILEAIERIQATASELSAAAGAEIFSADELLALTLSTLATMRLPTSHEGDAVVLYGWLEALWATESYLLIAGCHEGSLPSTIPNNDFLPESVRQAMGLQSNAERLERDAWYCHVILRQRQQAGRVDFLLGKTSSRGDALLPSRLLLSGDPRDLAQRTQHLFRNPPVRRQLLPATNAWHFFTPAGTQPPEHLSVTALRDYLACPFRYYLQHCLGMRSYDPFKEELDALDFGNLCHYALEQLNTTEKGRNATQEQVISDTLLAALNQQAKQLYGPSPSLAVRIQLEGAQARLHAAAVHIARSRAEGWFPLYVEWKFHQHTPFVIGGLPLHGKIDLIEENRVDGRWRLIDYKTSDTAVTPERQHLRRSRDERSYIELLASLGHAVDSSDKVWRDLQLPIYRIAVRNAFDRHPDDLSIGYFNLPKAVSDTGLYMWDPYSASYDDSARECCEKIVAGILAGRFWPPEEKVPYDDFAPMFLPDIAHAFSDDEALHS